jgi:hypothetical protein
MLTHRRLFSGAMVGAQVVHETLDGETVVINLASGTYYSLEGTATRLWEALVTGETAQATASQLADEFGADPASLLAAIETFHGELFAEQLIDAAPGAAPPPAGGSLGTFEPPQLRAYTDLGEHLLLDPIHDVERGEGWPAVPSA